MNWYSRASANNRKLFRWLKVLQLVSAAAVPVAVSVSAAPWITASLGGVVVVVEGIQQLGQFQQNWLNYRLAAEALKRERFLYTARAGPYASAKNAPRLLAERSEGIMSLEQAKWHASLTEEPTQASPST